MPTQHLGGMVLLNIFHHDIDLNSIIDPAVFLLSSRKLFLDKHLSRFFRNLISKVNSSETA
jgi:hypothetical protein